VVVAEAAHVPAARIQGFAKSLIYRRVFHHGD
jgi:hypothetical protein